MIQTLHLFASQVLYNVNFDLAVAIPLIAFVALFICIMIKEFSQGLLRYSLAFIFIASFSALWFILELDNPPFNYVLVVVIIVSGLAGLWSWIRELFNELRKI